MNTLIENPATLTPTQRVLERLRSGHAQTKLHHGQHQTNLRLLAWQIATIAKYIFSRPQLRDNLRLIAVTALAWLPWSFETSCDRIIAERARQEELLALGKFNFNCAMPHIADLMKLPVLVEEIGEVAEAILEGNSVNLSTELVQVAAVCVAWLEALEGASRTGEGREK